MSKFVSVGALLACYVIMIYTAFFFYPKWEQSKGEATLSWDASGYYMYLPALLIYKDIKQCSFKDIILEKYRPTPDFQQAFRHGKSGNYVMKYSSGHAITMLPFFLIAHSYCKLTSNYPPDGFSYPYQICIGIGMLLYALWGLFMLRKILLIYYTSTTVSILILCYTIGTNYLNYSSIDNALTHNVLFTIYCLIVWATIQYHQTTKIRHAIMLGSLIGLAALIRPTDIVAILIPIFWNINSVLDVRKKINFVKQNLASIISIGAAILCIGLIQLIYWKFVTDEWLIYSYGEQGFSWLRPHILSYTFSYACGWLRYCPMMILPLVGAIIYFFDGKQKFSVLSFIAINSYIVMAWDVWDYGGVAGRAMVQSYPLLAFPFCSLIERMWQNNWSKLILTSLMVVFGYLNIWWTYHAHAGDIQITGLTKEYYWRVVGRWNSSVMDKKLLDNPHSYTGVPKNTVLLFSDNFNADTTENTILIDSNRQIRLSKDVQFSAKYRINNDINIKDWIRASADFQCTIKEWDVWRQTQFLMSFKNHETEVQTNLIRVHRLITDGENKRIFLDAIPPNKEWTHLEIYFWNAGGEKEIYIDNLEVISFSDELH